MSTFSKYPSASASGGANQSLSNLSAPTAINQPLLLPNGSAPFPSLSFTNSPTTGLYRQAADSVSLALAGVEQLRLTGNGFGGLGMYFTADPGTLAVGITPGATGVSNLPGDATIITSSSLLPNAINIYTFQGNIAGSILRMRKARGTLAAPAAVQSADNIGVLRMSGWDGSAFVADNAGGVDILGLATQAWTTSNRGSSLRISTTPNNTAAVRAALTIDQNSDVIANNGNIIANLVGKGLQVKAGTNAKLGTAVLAAGTVTVANTSITANSRIMLTSQVDGGTPGFLRVSATSVGASFTITSGSNTDTSTVAYLIVESL